MLNIILDKITRNKRETDKIIEVSTTVNPNSEKQNKFNNILSIARSVIETTAEISKNGSNPKEHPLIDLVRLLGRDIQTKYLIHLTYSDGDSRLPNIAPELLLFREYEVISNDGTTFNDVMKKVESKREIKLSKDLILPWPWKRERLVNSISYIGEGRFHGAWEQDFYNHDVILWLPLGIAWVYGGNHSITSSIIQGEGKIKPRHTCDISNI